MAPRPGTRVSDSVTLLRPLGRGGMGAVWIARHDKLETEVAVKFIAGNVNPRDPAILARFQKEAALSAQLRSPHVVKTFDHGRMDDGRPYLVMELLEGETLGDRLARIDALPLDSTLSIATQIGAVLDEAHTLGIVHRDIKPDNVFLVASGDEPFVKVLDFGIAKQNRIPAVADVTSPGSLLGTPEYMSPEQLLSGRTSDPNSDRWALAVLVYRCLVGRVPFTGETLPSLTLAICHADFDPPSEVAPVSPELDPWFARAFAIQGTERFSSAREMTDELRRIVSGAPMAPQARSVEPRRARARISPVSEDLVGQARSGTMSGAASEVPRHARSDRRSLARLVLGASTAALLVAWGADRVWRRATPVHTVQPAAHPLTEADEWRDAVARPNPSAPPAPHPPPSIPSPGASVVLAPGAVAPSASSGLGNPPTRRVPGRTVKPGCESPYQLDGDGDLVPKPGCM